MCDCDKPYRRIHQVNSELVNTKNALILSQNHFVSHFQMT